MIGKHSSPRCYLVGTRSARALYACDPGAKEEDVGFEIFTDTTEEYREKLAGSDTEQVYLTSGTYHRLADTVVVGWHPRFKELMSDETS